MLLLLVCCILRFVDLLRFDFSQVTGFCIHIQFLYICNSYTYTILIHIQFLYIYNYYTYTILIHIQFLYIYTSYTYTILIHIQFLYIYILIHIHVDKHISE